MPTSFSITQWLKTRVGRASLAVVIACGLGLVFFVWSTFVDPTTPQYDLDFTGAKWIEPPTPSPNGYYRKTLFLPTPPQQAWIQVAASDSFVLYVNGAQVDAPTFVSTGVAGLYDLTGILTPGKNVIAISVSRDSFPGSAQLIVRGAYRDQKNIWQEFASDESWKASALPAGVHEIPWRAVLLDDGLWEKPRLTGRHETTLALQPVPLDPRLIQIAPQGKWIGPPDLQTKEAGFERTLDIKESGAETWLQISATGSYELLVNGGVAAKRPTASVGLDVYRITPWLHRGKNSIIVRVRPDVGIVGLFVDGTSFSPLGAVKRLPTDESWRISSAASQPSSPGQAAVALASYGDQPWGLLKKRFADVESYHLRDFISATGWVFVMALIFVGVIVLWLVASRKIAAKTGADEGRALAYDALLHAPLVAAMILLLFLGYDVRFHSDWPFHPVVVVALVGWLLVMRVFLSIHLTDTRGGIVEAAADQDNDRTLNFAARLALIVIVLIGFTLRAKSIGFMSLDHDEITMVKMAKGVLTTGYPHAQIGNISKQLTTYELVPYPIALSALVFGWRDWAVRLPSLVFGTMTIYFVGLIGTRLFGRRTGVLAALIWAFLPWAIHWSRNAFYPQQTQFFALLTFWHFYEALQMRPWDRRHLKRATIFFCITYLSWEGAGFILPALALAVIVMQPQDWSWLRNGYFWRCLSSAAVVVIVQQLHRMALVAPYLMVGSGLSDLGLPTAYFLDPMYDPLFYVRNFLGLENNVVLSLVAVTGLLFCWRDRALRYIGTTLVLLILLYTNLLGAYASRYAYYYAPLLALTAAAVCIRVCDGVSAIVTQAGTRHWAGAAGSAKFAFVALLFLSASGLWFDMYRLSSSPPRPAERTRIGVYNIDYRGASRFVKEQLRPGDTVIPAVPHTFEFYAGLPSDYFVNTLLAQRVVFDPSGDVPRFTERFVGSPVLRDLGEFQDAVFRRNRVWVIATPYPIFNQSNDKTLLDFLDHNARVMYESYEARVYLLQSSTAAN